MTEATVDTKTGVECRITLVTPGQSDRMIKIFPSEHTEEKIWLDNTPGIERWEMIQRMIQLHASRFSPVPEPKPWHDNPKDLKTVTLKENEIPLVKLENFILPEPPKEKIDPKSNEPEMTAKQWDDRFTKLESTVDKLVHVLMAKNMGNDTEPSVGEVAKQEISTVEKRKPGRPKKTA